VRTISLGANGEEVNGRFGPAIDMVST
jgi:hypothetical protein